MTEQDWQEDVAHQATEDFFLQEASGDTEAQLSDLRSRATELKDRLLELRSPTDSQARSELFAELERIGPQIDDLEVELPFVGMSDDELTRVAEDRKIEEEQLWSRARRAANPSIEGYSETLAARLRREATAARFATAGAEVALKRRGQRVELKEMAEATARKKAENDARDAKGQEAQAKREPVKAFLEEAQRRAAEPSE